MNFVTLTEEEAEAIKEAILQNYFFFEGEASTLVPLRSALKKLGIIN